MTDFNDRRWGSKDVETVFPGGAPKAVVPMKAASRSKRRESYDKDLVHGTLRAAMTGPEQLKEYDPRTLRATQPMVTRAGVEHYLNTDQFEHHGTTFADQGNIGNRHPFVYEREDGEHLLLSGHHRGVAAILKGQPLRARSVAGPWGKERNT